MQNLKNAFSSKNDQDRYLKGFRQNLRNQFSERIRRLALGFSGIDEYFLEELMIVLLEADIGIKTAQKNC